MDRIRKPAAIPSRRQARTTTAKRPKSNGSEAGQVLVFTALFLTALMGLSALAIDVGSWYLAHRRAQAAADAGALAGAQKLPYDASAATTDAQAYVTKNLNGALYGAPVTTITTPYKGTSDKIAVDVRVKAPAYFAKLFGFNSVTVHARAAAENLGVNQPYAIFAYNQSCSAGGNDIVTLNGNNFTVTGATHSNGSFYFNGQDDKLGDVSYGGPAKCKATVQGQNNTMGGPYDDPSVQPWPENYDKNSIPCDFTASNFSFNANNTKLPAGTYCATNTIDVNGNNLTGSVTFVGKRVNLNGNNLTFTPYHENLFILHWGTSEFYFNSNNYDLTGTIFVPNATLRINGNNTLHVTGLLEGLNVTLNGNDWTLNGNGPPLRTTRTTLIE